MDTIATATITSKGQVVIPKAVRDRFNLKPSVQIAFKLDDNDNLIIQRAPTISDLRGILKSKKTGFTDEDYNKAIEKGVVEDYLVSLKRM